jgi:hypothetical protein
MKPISIGITAIALLLVVAADATAHHVYETRLSPGYAPILQAAMTRSYEERTAYTRLLCAIDKTSVPAGSKTGGIKHERLGLSR